MRVFRSDLIQYQTNRVHIAGYRLVPRVLRNLLSINILGTYYNN